MSSTYGRNIRISIFGQSHSEAIGVVIDGFPPGFCVDMGALRRFLDRRAPGRAAYATPRREDDIPEFLSGLSGGVTCGAPLAAVIRNTNTHPSDYSGIRDVPRPGHADFTAQLKYKGAQDVSGGGHFSGRLTAPLCVAGGICLQYLEDRGITIAAHIASIGNIGDARFDAAAGKPALDTLRNAAFPVMDASRGEQMLAAIEAARSDGDSLGGTIECIAVGVPGGIGDPMFGGLESRISAAVFGIPAVKGIEFGSGFAGSELRGSENNDSFYMSASALASEPAVKTRTNNHGGILGGISSGMPVLFRVAVKPTPSIAKEQLSVSLSGKANVKMTVKGRHDPCIVPRAVPIVEAAAAVAILDALLDSNKYQ